VEDNVNQYGQRRGTQETLIDLSVLEQDMLKHALVDECILKTRADESAKFLRHLTYNHNEVVQAVMEDLPKQKRDQEPDFYK
jgi:hypothetical protein